MTNTSGKLQVTLQSSHPTEATVERWTLPAHVLVDGDGSSVAYLHPRIAEALHIKDGDAVQIIFHELSETNSVSVPIQLRARMSCDVMIPDLVALGIADSVQGSEIILRGGVPACPLPPQNMWSTDASIPKERRGAARLYFDGISRDSPNGPCGYGFHIIKGTYSARGEELVQGYGYAGMDKSSNEMEYHGLLEGLYWACRLDLRNLQVFGVSETIIKQLTGEYTIKNRRLKVLYDRVKSLLERNAGMKCKYQRIHREENDIAESLSNMGITKKETVITCHWPHINHLMSRDTPGAGAPSTSP